MNQASIMILWKNSRFVRSDKKMAILKEFAISQQKGFIVKQGCFNKNPPFNKKGLFIMFDLPENSHTFSFLLVVCLLCTTMHIQSSHTCVYILISLVAVQTALDSIMRALCIYNALALFSTMSKNLISCLYQSPSPNLENSKEVKSQLSSLLAYKQSLKTDFQTSINSIGHHSCLSYGPSHTNTSLQHHRCLSLIEMGQLPRILSTCIHGASPFIPLELVTLI